MEDKYYTPEIEEFHIGFEYEITTGYEWVKKPFTHEDFNTFLYQHLDNAVKQEQVRVKYLDKEDIESLGFTYFDNTAQYMLINNSRLRIIPYDNPLTGRFKIVHYDDAVLFHGFIKNKSELKVLLKQLNIMK